MRWWTLAFVLPLACGVQFAGERSRHHVEAAAVATCPDDAGRGGNTASANSSTRGGHGCVVIDVAGSLTTFVHSGANQSWTVPAGVTSVVVHLIGAGGGGGRSSTTAYGGGGGYVTGRLSVTAGQAFDVIVGGGGIRQCTTDVPLLADEAGRRNFSFGGGASGNGSSGYDCTFAAGGGRSAIRLAGSSDDLVTAGGGGGGGYNGAGGAGGGTTGVAGGGAKGGGGGTQSAGGATDNPEPGVDGIKYAGGWAGYSVTQRNAASEAGGGGGGWYGGGAGGDNGGGGGGSSYLGTLTSASTVAGSGREAGIDPPANGSAPTVTGPVVIGTSVTAGAGSWTHGGESNYRWQSSADNVTFSDIAGATSAAYVPDAPGYLRVVETRTNFLGSTNATSNVVTVADTTLSALVPSAGTFVPTFSSAVRAYAVSVPYRTRSISIAPSASNGSAVVRVDGSAVNAGGQSRAIDLAVGANSVNVTVTVSGVTTTTVVTVTRAAATVPAAPTIDRIEPGESRATVTFSAPSDDGGEAITGYEYSTDGTTWLAVSPSSAGSFVIAGLTNDAEITVRLRALNSVGAGQSSAGTKVTPTAPVTSTSSVVTTSVLTTSTSTTSSSTTVPVVTVTTPVVVTTVAPPERPAAQKRTTSTIATSTSAPTTTTAFSTDEVVPESTTVSPQTTMTTTSVTLTTTVESQDAEMGAPAETTTTTVKAKVRKLELVPRLASGRPAAGSQVDASAEGLLPGSKVVLELHSVVRVLDEQTAASDGSAKFSATLPEDTESGVHQLVLRGTLPDGSPIVAVAPFSVGEDGLVERVLPVIATDSVPSTSDVGRMLSAGAAPYDPADDFSGTAALATAAVVVMGLAGGASSNGSRKQDGSSDRDPTPESEDASSDVEARDEQAEGSLSSTDAKYLDAVGSDLSGFGDRSALWRTPGWSRLQRVLARVVAFLSTKSTLLVRVVQDGAWVRASFGVLGMLPAIVGFGVGVAAAASVHAMALPPGFGYVVAMVALSFVDALAGAIGWVAFVIVVALNGGVASLFDIRTLLGLGVLFAGMPLVAGAIRPVVRAVNRDGIGLQRVGDYLMMPIFLGYAASATYGALNGLSGLAVVASSDTQGLRNFGFAFAVGRLVVEDVSLRLFPARRREVELPVENGPGRAVSYTNVGVLWLVYLLTAGPYMGLGWRTWVIVTLMSIVPLVKIHKDSLPNSTTVHRWFPRGILRASIMLFVGAWYSRWVLDVAGHPSDARTIVPYLMLPAIAIGLIDGFGRKGGSWRDSSVKQLAGFALWIVSLSVLVGWITP